MNFPMLAVKNAKRQDFKDQKRKTARFRRSKTQNGTLSGGVVSTPLSWWSAVPRLAVLDTEDNCINASDEIAIHIEFFFDSGRKIIAEKFWQFE